MLHIDIVDPDTRAPNHLQGIARVNYRRRDFASASDNNRVKRPDALAKFSLGQARLLVYGEILLLL